MAEMPGGNNSPGAVGAGAAVSKSFAVCHAKPSSFTQQFYEMLSYGEAVEVAAEAESDTPNVRTLTVKKPADIKGLGGKVCTLKITNGEETEYAFVKVLSVDGAEMKLQITHGLKKEK